jgi:hypothetical protein
MGDFNEDFNVQGNQVNTMLKDCGLANVITKVHEDHIVLPKTYDRGTKCFDLIAIIDSKCIIIISIIRAGYTPPFYHKFCTNHHALYYNIDTHTLFGSI